MGVTVGFIDGTVIEYDARGFTSFAIREPLFTHPIRIHQLTIHYKGGETFHVKNAYNIEVVKHKSGGYDVHYDYDYKEVVHLNHGVEKTEADVRVETQTHDVVGLTLETRKDIQVYEKRYVGFGGGKCDLKSTPQRWY